MKITRLLLVACAGLALAATREIRVGLGVVSACVRHPPQLAMELATLARAYPERFMPGIGLSVPAWMEQMGLNPASPMTAIRECVTINRATEKEDGITSIGSHNFLMACCHVAHDCRLGNHIIIANSTLLGGHVHIHDHASPSGRVGVHHYPTTGS